MKGLIFLGVLAAGILVVALNPHLAADQVMNWVKQNPKYPSAPDLLYDTGRMCQFLTDGDTAIEVYNDLYQSYPDKAALCAPAMYYCGEIKADSGYIKVFRLQAVPYLQIILDQYSDQAEWVAKAQTLMNEVNSR
ncbi:MAG TPA: hypothetical protein VN963_02970 [bacterium]|jgi:hypothetical protein|nr:hypothetical protein [bacterium]